MNWMGGGRSRANQQRKLNNPIYRFHNHANRQNELKKNNNIQDRYYVQQLQDKRPSPLLNFIKENVSRTHSYGFVLQLSHQMELDSLKWSRRSDNRSVDESSEPSSNKTSYYRIDNSGRSFDDDNNEGLDQYHNDSQRDEFEQFEESNSGNELDYSNARRMENTTNSVDIRLNTRNSQTNTAHSLEFNSIFSSEISNNFLNHEQSRHVRDGQHINSSSQYDGFETGLNSSKRTSFTTQQQQLEHEISGILTPNNSMCFEEDESACEETGEQSPVSKTISELLTRNFMMTPNNNENILQIRTSTPCPTINQSQQSCRRSTESISLVQQDSHVGGMLTTRNLKDYEKISENHQQKSYFSQDYPNEHHKSQFPNLKSLSQQITRTPTRIFYGGTSTRVRQEPALTMISSETSDLEPQAQTQQTPFNKNHLLPNSRPIVNPIFTMDMNMDDDESDLFANENQFGLSNNIFENENSIDNRENSQVHSNSSEVGNWLTPAVSHNYERQFKNLIQPSSRLPSQIVSTPKPYFTNN